MTDRGNALSALRQAERIAQSGRLYVVPAIRAQVAIAHVYALLDLAAAIRETRTDDT